MASVHGEASQLEVKLVGMIEDLRRSDDVNDVHLLNKQIRQYMDELRTKIKNLEGQSRKCRTEDEREQLNGIADWHSSQLIELQKKLQRANLTAKTRQDQRDRYELFESLNEEDSAIRLRKRQSSSMHAASHVTESLTELRQTLAASLKSSEDTTKTLVDSSGVLRQSNTEMKNMGSHIDISTRLITKFGRRQVVDKLLILFGLVLFFSVVLYILKKRLFG